MPGGDSAGRRRDGPAGGQGDLAEAVEVDRRHRQRQVLEDAVGEVVVAVEEAAEAAAPGGKAAVGVELEGGFAGIQGGGDVVGGQLQECRALRGGVTAAGE